MAAVNADVLESLDRDGVRIGAGQDADRPALIRQAVYRRLDVGELAGAVAAIAHCGRAAAAIAAAAGRQLGERWEQLAAILDGVIENREELLRDLHLADCGIPEAIVRVYGDMTADQKVAVWGRADLSLSGQQQRLNFVGCIATPIVVPYGLPVNITWHHF